MTNSRPPATSPRPFTAAPDPSRYFPASAMEEARQRVTRSIQRGEGPVLVIGEAGLGKTMLLEVIAQQFREQLRSILLIGGQLCTRRALLQMTLFQLDLPYRGLDESELRLSLLSYLQPQDAEPRRILLLVDEADALPTRLLEELRVLTNVSAAGEVLINLVLAGNATLEEQFADPKLDLFSQRISARCYLSAFGRDQTFQYVLAQVAASGADPAALFTEEGLEAIFSATDGVPRLINQLGDQLLWMLGETGYTPLDGMIVQQAWSELQQLPAPWNTQSSEPAGVPVEYGELDLDDDDSVDVDDVSEFDVTAHNVSEFDVTAHNVSEFDATEHNIGTFDETERDDSELDNAVRSDSDNHLREFDQSDLQRTGCFDEDDDLPASIPITATQPIPSNRVGVDSDCRESTGAENLDVTEQLLLQLSAMDATESRPETTDRPALAAARNPFVETFESEEIVLDRYSTFESHLLADAPRVANRTDTAFAQQLHALEATETRQSEDSTVMASESNTTESFTISVDETSDSSPAHELPPAANGNVLVIEESEQPKTEIVNGQEFRQLFSSLEAADGEPCFG